MSFISGEHKSKNEGNREQRYFGEQGTQKIKILILGNKEKWLKCFKGRGGPSFVIRLSVSFSRFQQLPLKL